MAKIALSRCRIFSRVSAAANFTIICRQALCEKNSCFSYSPNENLLCYLWMCVSWCECVAKPLNRIEWLNFVTSIRKRYLFCAVRSFFNSRFLITFCVSVADCCRFLLAFWIRIFCVCRLLPLPHIIPLPSKCSTGEVLCLTAQSNRTYFRKIFNLSHSRSWCENVVSDWVWASGMSQRIKLEISYWK